MYLTCQKRRNIIRKLRDGSQQAVCKCAHSGGDTYGKEVDEPTCESCVLRAAAIGRPSCSPKPPANPIYKQPTYGKDSEIRYKPVDASEPPECPEGYARRTDDKWAFDSVWFPCPYRAFSDDLKPDGSLQVHAFCTIGSKKVTCGDCEQCEGELAQLEGSLKVQPTPETPALISQARTYWKAVKKWVAGGRPVRSDSEVQKIHANYCLQCDWYDKPSQRCKGCGCKVKPAGKALLNKAKMATEHCPRDFW